MHSIKTKELQNIKPGEWICLKCHNSVADQDQNSFDDNSVSGLNESLLLMLILQNMMTCVSIH